MIYGSKEKGRLYEWEALYSIEDDIEVIFEAEKKILSNHEEFTKKLLIEKHVGEMLASAAAFGGKDPFGSTDPFYSMFQYYENSRKQIIIDTIFQSHRKSAILSIFSIIEGQLRLITNVVESEFDFNIKLEDINGKDYLMQVWNYLKKVVEIDSAKIEPHFTQIKQQRYIRNKIAHNNSRIEHSKVQSIKQTKGVSSREIDGEDYVFIDNNLFIESLMNASVEFLTQILISINKRWVELKK